MSDRAPAPPSPDVLAAVKAPPRPPEAPKAWGKPAKAKKPKAASEHPSYSDMVSAAILALKERKGSSRQAILKHIQSNYSVKDSAGTQVKNTLKRMTTNKDLVQTSGVGASGSFKLNKDAPAKKKAVAKAKGVKPAATKKPTTKKPAAKKAAKKAGTPKKATATAKKPAAKKATTPKKPAKPKAAKKPAAKK